MPKDFNKTVQSVTKNLKKYANAMESDVQVLINCLLDLIEAKVGTLRKLIHLKMSIRRVKSISLEDYAALKDVSSCCPTRSQRSELRSHIANCDSLEQLSSIRSDLERPILYGVSEDQKGANVSDFVFDSILLNSEENTKVVLKKYIDLLLDSDDKENVAESGTDVLETKNIGDGHVQLTDMVKNLNGTKPDYRRLLDMLHIALSNYRTQEEGDNERAQTEPVVSRDLDENLDKRQAASDSSCIKKQTKAAEKKAKNNACI